MTEGFQPPEDVNAGPRVDVTIGYTIVGVMWRCKKSGDWHGRHTDHCVELEWANNPYSSDAQLRQVLVNGWKQRVVAKAEAEAKEELLGDIDTLEELLDVSEAQVEKMRKALEAVHSWLLAAPLATNDDMAQSFDDMRNRVEQGLGLPAPSAQPSFEAVEPTEIPVAITDLFKGAG